MPVSPLQRSFFLRYGAAIAISALAVVLRLSLLGPLGGRNPFLFFYPAIMVSSWYGGFGPGLLATTLTCLASIYYLMEPVYHFSVATPEDALALCVFVGMGLLMSAPSEAVHAARRRAEKVEATLRESEEQLRRQARALAAADERKNEFLAMLAHELRNPLAPILNAVEIMRARPNREQGERVREVIDRQVRHMARLLDDLLDVSRITRGKIELRKEPAALDEIVAQAVEMSRPLIESRRHELLISLPPEPVRWTADPVRMTQVLSNLLNNAAKYTEPGGRICLDAEREGDELRILVRDTGIGIAPELLPHIFDLFAQAEHSSDRDQGGLGIGLTLVKSLVEMHGGSVLARSEGSGHGSEFLIRLPLTRSEADPEPALVQTDPASGARRILVVDDNVDAAQTLQDLLELWGHEVRVAYEGEAALEIAAGYLPELLLLDIGLPGLDGYEVARRLRGESRFRNTLLIALTGYGQADDRRRSRAAGFDAHLVKPVNPDELRVIVTTARADSGHADASVEPPGPGTAAP